MVESGRRDSLSIIIYIGHFVVVHGVITNSVHLRKMHVCVFVSQYMSSLKECLFMSFDYFFDLNINHLTQGAKTFILDSL